jgi:pimeloyl-ACP methyl ester carboxylesterase
MREKYIDIKTFDGFKLNGVLCIPENIKAITIMCHGINSHKQEYLDMFHNLAERLYINNVGSIRFDFRGHGDSSGTDMDFDVISQLIDLKSIVCWLRKEGGLSKLPINFVGVSFGGAPGILHHSIYKTFQRISLFAPVISYYNTFVKPTTDWGVRNFNSNAWSKAEEEGYLLLDEDFKVSVRLLEEFLFIEPIEQLKELNIPIQIFHGTEDSFVPCHIVEELSKKFPNINIHIIQSMGHGLYIDGDEDGISEKSKQIQEHYYENVKTFLT